MSDSSNQTPLCQITGMLSSWLPMLLLRCFIAWEFWAAGLKKFNGDNWFTEIAESFPFPFNIVPTEISWFLATWTEVIGAVAILIGLFTRFWAAGLIVLDIVAWYSVHAAHGYNVCSNGYKLPLIFMLVLIVLLLKGAGKFSFDHLISVLKK